MQIFHINYPLRNESDFSRQVIAIGDFDGVHLGHREVISRATQRARELNVPAAVMTFHPHPREVLGQVQYADVLTPLADKMALLESLGIDHAYVVHFDKNFSAVTAPSFVHEMLLPLHPATIVVGFDFRFGHLAQGNADTLCEMGAGQFSVEVVRPFYLHEQKVSSTMIRDCLLQGSLERVNELLGRPYQLRGIVVAGEARGRQIGFPTANVQLDANYLIPKFGVYAVYITVDGVKRKGVMNIGVRPTFHATEDVRPSVEVHITDFSGDIYEQHVVVDLIAFIRPEQRFASLAELQEQIRKDVLKCDLLL